MASVTKADIPDTAKFMPMLWELIKKYYIPENTDEYWEACIGEANKAWEECQKDQLAIYLLSGLFNYLETKMDGKLTTTGGIKR